MVSDASSSDGKAENTDTHGGNAELITLPWMRC